MGHYCRICGRERANEQFSGKGHKTHVCKRCQAMPKEEREAIESEQELFDFLSQTHISPKNLVRLGRLARSESQRVVELAAIVLEVARVKPFKTRRLKFLAQRYPELLSKLQDAGLDLAHGDRRD
jgi:hypothetical protein